MRHRFSTSLLVGGMFPSLVFLLIGATIAAAGDPARKAPPAADRAERIKQRDALWAEARRLQGQGKLPEAIDALQRMLVIERECFGKTDPGKIADSLACLADLQESRENFAGARKAREEVLAIRSHLNGPADSRTVDARVALQHTEWLAKASPQQRKELAEAGRLLTQASNLDREGKFREAIPLADRCLSIRKRLLGDVDPSYAAAASLLGHVYCDMGDNASAEPLARQASEIFKKALGQNHLDYAGSLNNLAELYRVQGDYARAEPLLRQASEILKKALGVNHSYYALTLNNLAELYRAQRDYVRAEPLFLQALEVRRNVLGENHPDYAASLGGLAVLHQAQGDYARAEPLLRQVLEIRGRVLGESHPWYALSLNNLASLYFAQGDYTRAEPLFLQALEIERKTLGENHPGCASSLSNLARLYAEQGDYARAEPLFRQALEVRRNVSGENHPDYANTLNNLALLYKDQGEYARAEPLLRRAVAIIRKHLDATAAVQSERQQLSMLQSVRFYLNNYLTLMAQSGQYTELGYREMLAWKGIVLRRQRQLRAAEENQELAPVFAELQRVATQLARLAWATPDPKQEAGWRQRVAKLSEEEERLEAELSSRSTAYRQAKRQATLEELQAALPRDVVLVDFIEYRHYTPANKKKGTKESWQRRFLAFLVTHDHPVEMASLGAAGPIGEAINAWRVTFGMSGPGVAAARLLRQRLWEPIEARLHGAKIVLVSPDGALGKLPLGALPGKESGKYLLEELTIAIVPVPQLIPEIVQEAGRRELRKGLLLLGDVDYDAQPGKAQPAQPGQPKSPGAARGGAEHFDHLDGTREEIKSIARLCRKDLGDTPIEVLEQAGATKQAFRDAATRFGWLHLATHGFFAPPTQRSALASESRPGEFGRQAGWNEATGLHPGLLSGLAMTGANRGRAEIAGNPDADDGILTAEEIGTMNLGGADLVMLSACETGLGQTAGGEGLLGLQRAFQSAGARAVVASLWSVPDEETRALMEQFYTNLWQRKLSPLESLRRAQLDMLARPIRPGQQRGYIRDAPAVSPSGKRSPYYWAAFMLSGDWR